MTTADLAEVMQIQLQCYGQGLHESLEVIRRRLLRHPQQCWVMQAEQGICAYLFSYPSTLGSITELDGDFAYSQDPDCLYLHDLAVASNAAGRGIGPLLVRHALRHAREQALPHSALVAVQDSAEFWARQGFTQEPQLNEEQQRCLQSYSVAARYLTQPLH